jgi:hypothetical protein
LKPLPLTPFCGKNDGPGEVVGGPLCVGWVAEVEAVGEDIGSMEEACPKDMVGVGTGAVCCTTGIVAVCI